MKQSINSRPNLRSDYAYSPNMHTAIRIADISLDNVHLSPKANAQSGLQQTKP
jgi:hypothetical protein